MKKMIDYALSSVYMLYFGLLLLVFHVLQMLGWHLGGRRGQKRIVDLMNACILRGWLLTGTTVDFQETAPLPGGRPLVFVANHQSMFDIPPIIWFLRRFTPTFVSKVELARGIPGISYNLRRSGAALIDRKDSKQAISEIARLGKLIQTQNISAVIFPEGTRSASGQMRAFQVGGLATLLKRAPDALVVPIAIRGTGAFTPKGLFPLTSFSRLSWRVLPGIEPGGRPLEAVVQQAEQAIRLELGKRSEEEGE